MTFEARIKSDFETVFKARKTEIAGTLRLLIAALQNRAIEKRGKGSADPLTDEEVLEVLAREAKKRKEAAALYVQGGRPDLAAKEEAELEVFRAYLPVQMSEEEIKKEIARIVGSAGTPDPKEFGKLMGLVMKELKGKADAAVVTKLLKESLA